MSSRPWVEAWLGLTVDEVNDALSAEAAEDVREIMPDCRQSVQNAPLGGAVSLHAA